MKSSLASIFPNASASTVAANPQLMAANGGSGKQNAVAGIVERRSGNMNKTEAEFSMILEAQKRIGEILNFRFEAVKVRIGQGCFYVPDFFVERRYGKPQFIEVKGFMRDDARVKFLAAKEQHAWAEWQMWRKDKNTGWTQIL